MAESSPMGQYRDRRAAHIDLNAVWAPSYRSPEVKIAVHPQEVPDTDPLRVPETQLRIQEGRFE